MKDVSYGIKALHTMNPPLMHRDIKIENVLIKGNSYKLCDFGSVSSEVIDPNNIPKENYYDIEEKIEKNTT
jgi:AP2-associated kinase